MGQRVGGRAAGVCLAVLCLVAVAGALPVAAAAPSPEAAEVARIAAANGRSEKDVRQVLADPSARVGARNRIYHVDAGPTASEKAAVEPAGATAPYPYDQTFRLHSQPGSKRVIFLDFDGHRIDGTAWNAYAGLGGLDAEAFTLDDSPAFTPAEQDIVQAVWQRVAEDYAIFDVDVTTEDPGPAAITRSGTEDDVYGTRALITDNRSLYNVCGCGGMAYLGVFDDAEEHAYFQPALVFSRGTTSNPKYIAEATSHEVGHNFSLRHDGTSSVGYYAGHNQWAPIMGVSYSRPVTQWSKGEYASANTTEDDLATIAARGAPLLTDDHGDTAAEATPLGRGPTILAGGIITSDPDVDVFSVDAAAGPATFAAAPAPVGPNLDIRLELRSTDGTLLSSSDPPSAMATFDRATGLDASISISLAAGTYLLSVSGIGQATASTGYTGYGSVGRYSLRANLRQPAITLTSSPNPSRFDQPVTFTAAVTAPAGEASPTGTVSFDEGSATLCQAPLSGDQASCAVAVGAGVHDIVATYRGDDTFSTVTSAVVTQTVGGDPAVVELTSTPNPSIVGQPVTLRARLSSPDGAVPTGTVAFDDSGSLLCRGVPLAGGEATCTVAPTGGVRKITVTYGGDFRFVPGASSPLTQTVNPASTTIAVASSVNPSAAKQSVKLTASLSVVAPGAGSTYGLVRFKDGATSLCSSYINSSITNQAICWFTPGVGTYAITAVYEGAPSFLGSTSPTLIQVVDRAPSTVTLSSSAPVAVVGQRVLYRANVAIASGYGPTATGTVRFTGGGSDTCGEVPLSGALATCWAVPPRGASAVSATYAGDTTYLAATSSTLTQAVGVATTEVVVSSRTNPVPRGTAATLTGSVRVTSPGAGTPTGTVTFSEGAVPLCPSVALSSGEASCEAALGVGSHAITVRYDGDDDFAGATSPPFTQVVDGDPVAVVVTSAANPSVSGQAVALRATVASPTGDGSPTGTVGLAVNGSTFCTFSLPGDESACAAALLRGSHTVTATYSGDARFGRATSTLTQVVDPAATMLTLTSSANPVRGAQPLAFTASLAVTAPGGGTPAGAITFWNGGTVLCESVPLTAGGATCPAVLAEGSHRVVAMYGSSSDYGPSAVSLTQTVLPVGARFSPVTPKRLLDTRVGTGGPATALFGSETRDVLVRGGTTGIPEDATAVVLNTTATDATDASFLTVHPAGSPRPPASNLNFVARSTVPNLVVVGIGTGGRVSIYNAVGRAHVLADVVGYYSPSAGAAFTPLTPKRLLDTRIGLGGPTLGPSSTGYLNVRGGATGVPDDATAVVVNTTAVSPTAAGYLTVYPSGVPRPNASSLNFVAGQTVPNLVVVGVGSDGRIGIFNSAGRVQVLVDVVGYYSPSGGSTFHPMAATRVLDTRSGVGGPEAPIGPNATRDIVVRGGSTGVPEDATSVVLNVTSAFGSTTSYLTVFPAGATRPNASNLNFGPSWIVPNLVMVGIGNGGKASIYNAAGTVHVVVDVVGYTT